MIGFSDDDESTASRQSYALIGDSPRYNRSRACQSLIFATAIVGSLSLLVRTSSFVYASPSTSLAASPDVSAQAPKEDAAEACTTKPFGQCAGMNFTSSKADKDSYNFTAGSTPFACCPAGTRCVVFGPVWGMCMPAFGPPAAASTGAATALLAAPPVPDDDLSYDAEEGDEEPLQLVAQDKVATSGSDSGNSSGPCSTKPFGQCSGMDWKTLDPKKAAELAIDAAATPPSQFACCPEGTSCVSFGPVWGMCMPAAASKQDASKGVKSIWPQ